jgi:hypothetical protein
VILISLKVERNFSVEWGNNLCLVVQFSTGLLPQMLVLVLFQTSLVAIDFEAFLLDAQYAEAPISATTMTSHDKASSAFVPFLKSLSQ